MQVANKEVKCVVVGDGAVGKTCLLMTYTTGHFPTEYVPTVFDNYSTDITVNDSTISLGLWDTAGQEEYDRLRPLSYTDADIFVVCFSVTNPASLANVRSKWLPELAQHRPTAHTLLAGTKVDLRDDPETLAELTRKRLAAISADAAKDFAAQNGMIGGYVECSARNLQGVKNVFDSALMTALSPSRRRAMTGGGGGSAGGGEEPAKKCCVLM